MWFDELRKNLLELWQRLERKQRVGAGIAAAAVILLMAGLTYWTVHTSYEVLFTDLDERDAANIVAELKQSKIPYRLSGDGHRILVPDDQVHETRIQLMGKGVLLNGGVGFEIFDNKDLGMTEYTQKINYQRALQGELARTILSMAPVKLARVHLVLPETSIFKREKVKSKASVSLVLHPGGRLSGEQILGIQRLVAASVPGMEASAVTVLDQRGITLSALVDGDGEGVASGSKLRMKREVEEYLTRKIVEVMDRTYGPGQAIVSVDATLNFDEIHRTDQDVIPFATAGGEATGVLVRKRQSTYRQGRDSVTKTASNAEAVSSAPNLNSTSEVEYEVSRRVEQVVTAPGGIRRLSIGVLLPGNVNEQQLINAKQVVSMVAGLSADRGDAIVVHGIDQLIMPGEKPATGLIDKDIPATQKGSGVSAWLEAHALSAAMAAFALVIMLSVSVALRARGKRRAKAGQQDARQSLLAEIRQMIEAEKGLAAGTNKHD